MKRSNGGDRVVIAHRGPLQGHTRCPQWRHGLPRSCHIRSRRSLAMLIVSHERSKRSCSGRGAQGSSSRIRALSLASVAGGVVGSASVGASTGAGGAHGMVVCLASGFLPRPMRESAPDLLLLGACAIRSPSRSRGHAPSSNVGDVGRLGGARYAVRLHGSPAARSRASPVILASSRVMGRTTARTRPVSRSNS